MDTYYILDEQDTNPRRLKLEREKARKLRKSSWWNSQIVRGTCHYCEQKVPSDHLTMDHLVPLARGGKSVPGNVVPCCKLCNTHKKLHTPVELILEQLRQGKK